MKLRIRRSGRHRAEAAEVLVASGITAEQAAAAVFGSGRCQGTTYRGKPCTLDAGPDGYCVFHKPGAAA